MDIPTITLQANSTMYERLLAARKALGVRCVAMTVSPGGETNWWAVPSLLHMLEKNGALEEELAFVVVTCHGEHYFPVIQQRVDGFFVGVFYCNPDVTTPPRLDIEGAPPGTVLS